MVSTTARKVLICLTLAFSFATFPPPDIFAQGVTLDQLRDQFKGEENAIIKKYEHLERQPGANVDALEQQLFKELKANREKFNALAGKDGRYTQAEVQKALESGKIKGVPEGKSAPGYLDNLQKSLAKEGLKLQSTGGSPDLTPSHINADVDAVVVRKDGSPATPAEQMKGIEIVKQHSQAKGFPIKENAARFDVAGQDLTIWKPDSPEAQAAKLLDHDAFKTEGGKFVTRNPGAVQDAHGEILDNRAKFEAARTEGDLKTQGKSLVKAGSGEAAGVKVIVKDPDGTERVVRKSDFKERNPELYEKAQKLKDYGTAREAGIADVPEFQDKMSKEMDELGKEARRKGKLRDAVRENFQESYEKAGTESPREEIAAKHKTDAELNSERAAQIKDERGRVVKSNQEALEAIAKDKARPAAKETFTGGRRGPGDAGYAPEGGPAQTPEAERVGARAQAKEAPGPTKSPSPAAAEAEMASRAAAEAGGKPSERLVSERTLAERRATMTGEKTPSLLEGGKSSSAHTRPGMVERAIQESGTGRAISAAQQAEAAALGKAGIRIGELGANAGAVRRGVNVAGHGAMTGLAVAGTALESYLISSGFSRAKILYDAAAKAKTEEERELYMAAADKVQIETSEHLATSAGMMAAGAASPIIVGGAMVGYGSYQGTRSLLEGTESGRAVEKTLQDGMTGGMTATDDLLRKFSGEKTVAEQERHDIAKLQEGWKRALDSGKVRLHEGATEEDLRVLIERMVKDGKGASLNDLGDLGNVIELSPETKVSRADCSKYPGTQPQWDATSGQVRCNCSEGSWSNSAGRCVSQMEIALAQTDCSGYPGTQPRWDEASRKASCACPEGTWSDQAMQCVSTKDAKMLAANCARYPGTRPQWDEAQQQVRCNCIDGKWSDAEQRCLSQKEIALAQADCSGYPGTRPQWDEAAQTVRCSCANGSWSAEAQQCVAAKEDVVARTDCSRYPGTEAFWDEASQQPRCRCVDGSWSNTEGRCVSEGQQRELARVDCSPYPGTESRWDASSQSQKCFCIQGVWSNTEGRCFSEGQQRELARVDCSRYPGTELRWDASSQSNVCFCIVGSWSNSEGRCISAEETATYTPSDQGDDYGVTDFVSSWVENAARDGEGSGGDSGAGSGVSSGCTPGRTAAEVMINQALGCPDPAASGGGSGGYGSGSSGRGQGEFNNRGGGNRGGGSYGNDCCANGMQVFMGQSCLDGSEPVYLCKDNPW